MDIKKPVWLYVLVVVLVAVLCSVFLFRNGGKSDGREMEAIAEQNAKLAEQDKRLAEQDKRLTGQDGRLAELERMAKKLDEIQAALKTREVEIKDYDMALIQEMIEKQVKLNVRGGAGPNIGVVSVQKIFQDCKRSVKYREDAITERDRVNAELGKLKAEIDDGKQGFRTLKVGSSDHMTLMKEILTKQANLQLQQTLYEQQRALKEQKMVEELYKDILRETSEVAEQKGLDLVFERSEPELPATTANELTMTISTHKLVYSGELLDVTDEVMTRLDSGQ